MMQIARATDKNCTARAISTMRLALGYETGLPETWGKMGSKTSEEFITLVGDCFPDRTVLLVCSPDTVAKASPSNNVKHVGTDWSGVFNWNEYLVAFSYGAPDINNAHLVIGGPVVYDSSFLIYLVVAISLQKCEK